MYQTPTVSKQSENIAKTHELNLISKGVPKRQTGNAGTILGVNTAQFPAYHTETANKDPDETLGQVVNCAKKKEVVKRIVFSGLMSGGGRNQCRASLKKEETTGTRLNWPINPVVSGDALNDGTVLLGSVDKPLKMEEISEEKLGISVAPGNVGSESAILPDSVGPPLKREVTAGQKPGIPVKVNRENCKDAIETRTLSAVSVRCTLCGAVLQGVCAFIVHAQEHGGIVGDPFSNAIIESNSF